MFKLLSDEEYKKVVGYIPIFEHSIRKVSKADQKNTLRQVVKWGKDYICEDCSTPNFIHLVIPKKVWAELEKEVGG